MAAGGTATANETVHLDPTADAADVVLAFDTTGSMVDALVQAKADAQAIVAGVQGAIPGARFAVTEFQDYPSVYGGQSTDFPYQRDLGFVTDASAVTAAIPTTVGDGGDLPEAYNRAFYEAYSDTGLQYAAGAQRFLIVLGDQIGHDAQPSSALSACAGMTGPTDPGRDGAGLPTGTVIDGLNAHNTSLSFVSYAPAGQAVQACQAALAAATGGSLVQGDSSANAGVLAAQIVTLVKRASAHIGTLTATASNVGDGVDAASWVSFSGLPASTDVAQTTGSDIPFQAVVNPPADAAPGTYNVKIQVTANGLPRASQNLAITVKTPLSGVTMAVTPGTAGAGIDRVPISTIPNAWLAYYAGTITAPPIASAPIGSSPIGSSPIGSSPIGSSPIGSSPIGSSPIGSSPIGSSPIGSSGIFGLPIGSSPIGSSALASILLSQITLQGADWTQILCGSLVGQPLQSLTLQDLAAGSCGDGTTSQTRFAALRFSQVDVSGTPLRSLHWSSLLLGNVPLSALPGGFDAWCTPVGGKIPAAGGDCTGASPATTVLQLDVAGRLGSSPIGSSPIGSSPIGSSPLANVAVRDTAVRASRLGLIPVDGLGIACSTACSNLADAATQNAIPAALTFSSPAFVAAMNAMTPAITVDDVVVALLGAAGFPWEQLPIQGLQPYSTKQSHVTYTLGATVDCSVVGSFSLTARLPDGFFPVKGTAKLSFNGGAASSAGEPDVGTLRSAKLNSYSWTGGCEGRPPASTASLSFEAYTGLRLGTFSSAASATAGSFTASATGAPVTVGQNLEPNDDASNAIAIAPDTLVAGHIAASGDQDNYSIDLTGLPRGTKVAAYLKVPSGADFDLTVTKPEADSFFSTPIGSSPIGSSPIEDHGLGFDTTGQPLPSETLQDIPIGSSPIGSSPIGSSSTTRGDANEAAVVITAGESGIATIGVSGYNGSTSSSAYVLRVHETPPPALPSSCPARSFSYGAPSTFAAGTLPASLPVSTKSVFVVNSQQLSALYGAPATTALLQKLGNQATAGSFAARSEVTGSVLDVSGSATTKGAYTAWNADPCSISKRNDVVRAINDVVAGYRNSATGLPNLHYVVLLGTDEATPMAASPDPVTLSPEQNEAAELAFTTNGLTTDNALYATSAQNYLLTDGAYGAFTAIPWLGHNLLLPQVSVSRLVETPDEMVGQLKQYLGASGYTNTPQTAPGTLAPTSAAVTGYDFMADGAAAMRTSLIGNFAGLSTLDTLGSDAAITPPGSTAPWTAADLGAVFGATAAAPGILAVNGHYDHYRLEAADRSLSSTAGVGAGLAARILFTMGCHGGLSVADTLSGVTGAKALDWPQLYSQKQVAMYIGNTGYGYGDTDSVALSERLLALFTKNLHSDAGSVGEEWLQTLQQYFATAGVYGVYDEKVLEETTFYGLPFWHFASNGTAASPAPVSTTTDAVTGAQVASFSYPSSGALVQKQFGLYRPTLPLTTQEVTSTLPARGLWLTSLASNDALSAATLGMPTVDSAAHEPKPNVQPIFFPASPFSLEHSLAFGKERDFVSISDQYRPGPTPAANTQRHFTSAGFQILYSNGADRTPPLISQVGVAFAGGSATITGRVSDANGVLKVAALVNDGTWKYVPLAQSGADPTLWSATTAVARDPEVFLEATDGINVGYSANKGSNFTSANSTDGSGSQIVLRAPVGPYALNQAVSATYQCVVGGVALPAVQCKGTVDNGQAIDTASFGSHTFVVKASDTSGNTVGSLQRVYTVAYPFNGFFSPVDNEPVLNVVKAGSAVPVKFSLGGNQGLDVLFDATYPRSQTIACDASAPSDPVETTVTAGSSSLSYDAGSDRYQYVWKTNAAWGNTCRALVVKTKDGVAHRAIFKFK